MDFSALFSWNYWLTLNPPNLAGFLGWVVLVVFAALCSAGIGLTIWNHHSPKRENAFRWRHFANWCLTLGFVGLILFFFSFEQIRLLGARFWYPIYGLWGLIWLVVIFRTRASGVSREVLERREREKYLPQAKGE
ncbi:hypothetical protein HYV73_00550 [Candidatus Uhrbacteria bacterium]|nr:hypothetical protein [Candidatus Uhrbacteria bacterium]